MPVSARRAALLTAALLVAPAAAQGDGDGVRRPTFVRVEDAQGAALAGAVVTFAGGIPHVGTEAGPRDVLQVQSDARGRAQAKLRPGLCYVAWAVGPADANGACAVAPVRGWFGAGALLTLRCAAPTPPRRVAIEGAAAWQQHGPLRYFAWTPMPGHDVVLTPDGDGRLSLPAGPFSTIEVQTADGVPLLHTMPLLHTTGDEDRLTLPPPRQLRVRARDENGAAVAGAAVRLRVGRLAPWRLDTLGNLVEERWRPLGTTDAAGLATVTVPYATDPLAEPTGADLMLFVGAAGRPSVAGGVYGRELYLDDRKVAKGAREEMPFTLKAVEPLVGNLGVVPAGTVVHFAVVGKLFIERTSYRHDARSFVVPVQPDGSFRCDDVPAELHSCRCSVVVPSGSLADVPLFPAVRSRELPPELRAAEPAVLRGGDFAELALQFLEPTGGPARGLVAYLTPAAQNGVLVRDATIRFPLDARGATTLRLAPGPWVVTAWTDQGWLAKVVDARAGAAGDVLTMQPHRFMRLQLRGGDGRAIAGARVVQRGTTTRGTGDPLQSVLQSLRTQWLAGWGDLATDAEGKVAIPFVPVDGVAQKLALQWDGGTTDDLVLEATEGWTGVGPR